MKAIEILVKEHDSILKMIEIAQKMLKEDGKTRINVEHIGKVIDFIRNFADKYHHLKEEDVLFKEMGKSGMPIQGGPIGVMLMEYDEGRAFVKQAVEGIEKYKQGDLSSFEQIKSNLLDYCELLIHHIHKENQIFYPMAEQVLPDRLQNEMAETFEKANSSTANNEYFDKYLKLVEELSEIYL